VIISSPRRARNAILHKQVSDAIHVTTKLSVKPSFKENQSLVHKYNDIFYPLSHYQTTEQLLPSDCETPQLIFHTYTRYLGARVWMVTSLA